jgi:riboflavin kinase/FMN adenylyltransferase
VLAAGQVSLAARLMGRAPSLIGTVVQGSKRGHELGIPTANLEVDNEMIPVNGVYITVARLNGSAYPGLTNIGHRPTISALAERGERSTVETHLFDFSADIYGCRVELSFYFRLRPERRFPSVRHLIEQIAHDRRRAERYFVKCKDRLAARRSS